MGHFVLIAVLLSMKNICNGVLVMETSENVANVALQANASLAFEPMEYSLCNCSSAPCPCTCISSGGIFVNCSAMNLSTIPGNIPKETVNLDLSRNQLTTISKGKFSGLKNLQNLDLSFNNISRADEGCFSRLVSLRTLNISMNNDFQFVNFRSVVHGLGLTKLEEFRASFLMSPNHYGSVILSQKFIGGLEKTRIKRLYMDADQIQYLSKETFRNLPTSLEFLSLRANNLGTYTLKNWFGMALYLQNLHMLDISYQCNKYEAFMMREYGVKHYRNVYEEQTSQNLQLEHEEFKDICYVPNQGSYSFNLDTKLKKIIAKDTFSVLCISKWKIGSMNVEHLDLSQNDLNIWLGPITVLSSKITHVDLSDNNCRWVANNFFDNITTIQTLLLSGNFLGPSINRVDFDGFKRLTYLDHLDLSRNQLFDIRSSVLTNQINLSKLNISKNHIKILEFEDVSLQNLSYIDASFNELIDLPKSVMTLLDRNVKTRNVTIDIRRNPFECTCKQLKFWTWVFNTKVTVRVTPEEVCKLENGEKMHLTSLSRQTLLQMEEMCRSNAGIYVSVGIVIALVVFIISLVVYKKRWEITYRWYIYRLGKRDYQPISSSDSMTEFDAFVSYCESDANFVKNTLLKKIESDYSCHLCLHERDFPVGLHSRPAILEPAKMEPPTCQNGPRSPVDLDKKGTREACAL